MSDGYTYDLYADGNLGDKTSIKVTEPPQGNTLYVKNGNSINVYAYRGTAPNDVTTFRFEFLHFVAKPSDLSATWRDAMTKVPKSMHEYAESVGFIVETAIAYTAWKRTYNSRLIRKDDSWRDASPEEVAMWSSLRTRMEAA